MCMSGTCSFENNKYDKFYTKKKTFKNYLKEKRLHHGIRENQQKDKQQSTKHYTLKKRLGKHNMDTRKSLLFLVATLKITQFKLYLIALISIYTVIIRVNNCAGLYSI